jgi:HEAT repeat protein
MGAGARLRRLRPEPPARAGQQVLIEQTRSGRTPAERADAALALAAFDSPEAARTLTRALADPALRVQAAAGIALASLRDPASTSALAVIVAGWTQPALASCRRAALRALTAFRSEVAAVELARALISVRPGEPLDLEERSALLAVVYAEPSGVSAQRVVRALVGMLQSGNSEAADRAASLLQLFPAESHAPLARALRRAASPAARRRAAESLGSCRHNAAVAALVAALEDPAAEVRRAAATALSDMRDPIAAAALHAAAEDPDDGVRRAAAKALGALGAVATATSLAAGLGEPSRGATERSRLASIGVLGARSERDREAV